MGEIPPPVSLPILNFTRYRAIHSSIYSSVIACLPAFLFHLRAQCFILCAIGNSMEYYQEKLLNLQACRMYPFPPWVGHGIHRFPDWVWHLECRPLCIRLGYCICCFLRRISHIRSPYRQFIVAFTYCFSYYRFTSFFFPYNHRTASTHFWV